MLRHRRLKALLRELPACLKRLRKGSITRAEAHIDSGRLRGAEAPLFHGTASISKVFHSRT